MRLLAIETSTDFGTCALWQDGNLLESRCPEGRPHSETLLPLIQVLLAEAQISLGALDGIAFGAGPGAFTGLRVACGVAQGLAVAAERPVVPVDTLASLALEAGVDRCLAALDARIGEVYWAAYERSPRGLQRSGDIRLSAPEAVTMPKEAGWNIAGNAIGAYPVLAQRAGEAGIGTLPGVLPRARATAALAAQLLAAGKAIDPALAAPVYVRDKVAQTVAERLAGGGKA